MNPEYKTLQEKKLVGKRLKMSLADNKTQELWKGFMLHRNEIKNAVSTDLYSVQIYPQSHFEHFNSANEFEKLATLEVTDFENIPAGMETFTLSGGLYAVFLYKGSSTDPSIFQYIFGKWLPNSEYVLDNRPHFEVLGERYKNNDPDSEEEIWIPVKKK